MFATSPLLWSQAVITEVYTLNALFAAALLLIAAQLALSTEPARTVPRLALFGFLFGIGLGNHLTLLAVGVPMLYWLWSALGWRRLATPWMVAAFALGAAVYVYLPIRAADHPPVNWGNADTLRGAFWMLTARPYQEYVFGVPPGSILTRSTEWLNLVFSQFNPLGLFLGITAARPLFSRAPRFFLPSLVSIAVISTYSIFYNTVDFEVLMIPAFLLFSVWIETGFFWILATWLRDFTEGLGLFQRRRLRLLASHQALVLSLLGFLLLPGTAVALNYGSQNLREDHRARDHAASIMDSVPDGSVVLSNEERDVFSLWYMRYVDRPERDVAVIAVPLLQFDWYLRDIRRTYPNRVPPITTADFSQALRRFVQHNDGRSRVFFTFSSPALADSLDLTRVGKVYEARLK